MQLGGGTHTYEWIGDWARLPPHIKPGYTHGVVVDAHDNVYIHNQSPHAVLAFDPAGNFLFSWGQQFATGAHGMYLSRENGQEFLYLADIARHCVVKTTLDGRELWTISTPDLPDIYATPEKFVPTDVAVSPNGDVYICDGYGQPYVHQYNQNQQRVRTWGGPGSAAGQLLEPHGIWIDTRGATPEVLVADRGNSRIQRFTLEGQPIGFVSGMLRKPCCFYQWRDELVVPDLFGRVTILDKDNTLITHLADTPEMFDNVTWPPAPYPNLPPNQRRPGHFISPHAACVDSRGDIYVVEWVEDGRITKLRRK